MIRFYIIRCSEKSIFCWILAILVNDIFAGLVVIWVNNRARSISHEANFHRHLVPHPSKERKLDKEREDILMWETEHKKREPIKRPLKDNEIHKKTHQEREDANCGKPSIKKGPLFITHPDNIKAL